MKQKKFEEAVIAASQALGVPIPHINFEVCPHEGPFDLAHFHPDSYTICVSRTQLNMMNFDDIHNAATHEVAHTLELAHDTRFVKIQENTKTKIWKPGSGMNVIRGGKPTKKVNVRKKVKRGECKYHPCEMKGTFICDYCGGRFCENHAKPAFARYDPKVKPKYEEAHGGSVGGHPCPEWSILEYRRKKAEKLFDNARYEAMMGKRSLEEVLQWRCKALSPEELDELLPIITGLLHEEKERVATKRQIAPQQPSAQGIFGSFVAWLKGILFGR